jgi:hypothetical protein
VSFPELRFLVSVPQYPELAPPFPAEWFQAESYPEWSVPEWFGLK